jgi:protein TonB
MAKDIDLTSKEWLDFVFEGKNKEYGAYELRENSSNRHIKALVVVIVAGLAFIFLPQFIQSMAPQKEMPTISQQGEVTIVDFDENKKPAEPETPISQVAPPPALAPAVKFADIKIVPDDKATDEDRLLTQIELDDPGAVIATVATPGEIGGKAHPDDFLPEKPGTGTDGGSTGRIIHEYVDQPPMFPGGEKELMKWLGDNLKYPVLAIEQGIEGRVVLRFVVGPDGSVSRVEIQRSLEPSCDREAVRVVKNMPKWIPGKKNGEAVYVYYTLPVLYKLYK